ncbi:4'-phosphopantetheinyl transferase superfamily protein [Enterococcus gilvus]|uniref:4'-phosphopantetheinyl transferase family protein n=1 Tax=Enterococcus gilvus TaxID=160453 RepID=UPI001C8B14E8|nr:4'-phosphopantetheinyl transferase superfamily protein [Enterococcus gilvus]MBX8936503.1 4'-phosphopantetheinyl transferase superfamily protein [Enterococcus gilvus]
MKKVVIYPVKELLYDEVMRFVRTYAPKRHKYSSRFYNKEDRYNSAVAYVLLCIAYGYIIQEFEVGTHGKPYFKEHAEYLSISHSNGIVAVVISDNEIAIDCESKQSVDKTIVNKTFTEKEKELIEKRNVDESVIWTAKEAISKFWNEDWYSYPRTEITIGSGTIYDKKNSNLFLEFIDFEDYSLCVASKSKEKIEVRQITESVIKEMIE